MPMLSLIGSALLSLSCSFPLEPLMFPGDAFNPKVFSENDRGRASVAMGDVSAEAYHQRGKIHRIRYVVNNNSGAELLAKARLCYGEPFSSATGPEFFWPAAKSSGTPFDLLLGFSNQTAIVEMLLPYVDDRYTRYSGELKDKSHPDSSPLQEYRSGAQVGYWVHRVPNGLADLGVRAEDIITEIDGVPVQPKANRTDFSDIRSVKVIRNKAQFTLVRRDRVVPQ